MTWATPVQNVGTDTRQFGLFTRKAKTGALQGGFVPFLTQTLGESELAVSVLATSVLGSIAEHALKFGVGGTEAPAAAAAVPPLAFPPSKLNGRLPPELGGLQDAFKIPGELPAGAAVTVPSKGAYETRVLQGIGPPRRIGTMVRFQRSQTCSNCRPSAHEIQGRSSLRTANVGLAVDQVQFNYELETSGCSDPNSGNSRCGHEFGTSLSRPEKKALLEYLKTL